MQGGAHDGLKERLDGFAIAVARQASSDQRIVVRPDRSIVIGHRIVARLAMRDGTDAPTRIVGKAQKLGGDFSRAFRPGDARKEGVAGVAGTYLARGLATVERQRVTADLFAPKALLEAPTQSLSLPLEFGRPQGFAKPACADRRPLLGGIDITLHLNKRDGA